MMTEMQTVTSCNSSGIIMDLKVTVCIIHNVCASL